MKPIISFTTLILLTAGLAGAAEPVAFEELLGQARAAFASGKTNESLALMNRAIAAGPEQPGGYFLRGRFYEENGQPAKAIADFDQVIKLDPHSPDAWQHRGGEQFKLGHIKESLADFDKFIELVPSRRRITGSAASPFTTRGASRTGANSLNHTRR